ncbi:glutaredoxin family protein [Pseudonocardia alaniniphila]|uniref:Glutaredoxin family protein n=1 Tax=Pseudonocardia alaniniphila TaxID=75291 RepID=A0ABS9T9N6_9PSEU|nr:glutaredoxin family protein [Pseudonocardia alaniniphila]MCH6165247.1 glutaredoxin family protein [Pseudonocardia alaniniphila]
MPGPVTNDQEMTGTTVEVTVLTQPDCRFCELAAEVLARVGRDHPLSVRHIDLASPDGRDLAAQHGVLFAPGILLDGQMFSYGRLSERRLRRHLTRTTR